MSSTVGAEGRIATMRDVAALAAVSIKTVSRVVNAEPGVSPELETRVLEAVRMLGYRHNLVASNLRRTGRKTAALGLILQDVDNPFDSALHRAVERVASARGVSVFAASNEEQPERQGEVLDALVSRRVDGLIVIPVGQDHDTLLNERRLGIPLVCVDRLASQPDVDNIVTDNRAAARTAVTHLTRSGHRRIAYLGDLQTIWTAAERYAGYVEALATTGTPLAAGLVRLDLRRGAAVEQVVTELLTGATVPTAIFSGQNLITVGVIRVLQRLGLQHRIALVGFDDLPLGDLLDPGLTAVAQDPSGVGTAAATRLFDRLDGDTGPARTVVVPSRLVIRGSGEIPPAQPRSVAVPSAP